MAFPPPGLSHYFLTNQKAKLDTDPGKADTLTARVRGGGDIVIARQLPTAHPGAIVHRRQGTK